jgi:predicted GIY-YIG superfamily endonuclease
MALMVCKRQEAATRAKKNGRMAWYDVCEKKKVRMDQEMRKKRNEKEIKKSVLTSKNSSSQS